MNITTQRHRVLDAGLLFVATTACSNAADTTGLQIGGSAGVLLGGMIGSGMTAGSIAGTLVGAATGGVLGSSLGLIA
jgi:hypothetical protein